MRWFDSLTDSIGMNASKLWERVEDREAWHAAVHGVTKSCQFSDLYGKICKVKLHFVLPLFPVKCGDRQYPSGTSIYDRQRKIQQDHTTVSAYFPPNAVIVPCCDID